MRRKLSRRWRGNYYNSPPLMGGGEGEGERGVFR